MKISTLKKICYLIIGLAAAGTMTIAHANKRPIFSQAEIATALGWTPSATGCHACDGHYRQPEMLVKHQNPIAIKQALTRITATGPTRFAENGISVLTGHVVVTQPGRIIHADRATLYRDNKTHRVIWIHLSGHVRIAEYEKLIVTNKATLNLAHNTLYFGHLIYHIYEPAIKFLHTNKSMKYNAWGTASKAVHLANGNLELYNASYTTCPPLHPTWMLHARKMIIDRQKGVGKAKDVVLRLHNMPVFFLPHYSFPIYKKRKTGFLGIDLGYAHQRGFTIADPFYWNLAPNYDLTLTPTYMSERGVMFSAFFRYMTESSQGYLYASVLPGDQEFARFKHRTIDMYSGLGLRFVPYLNELNNDTNTRGYFSALNTTHFSPRLSLAYNLNWVTDAYYMKDFGSTFQAITANQLLNQVDIIYSGVHWVISGLIQAFQTLHLIGDINHPAFNQYTRLPEIDIAAHYPNLPAGLNFNLSTQAVYFAYHSSFVPFTFQKPIGGRFHIRPSLSRPFVIAYGFFTPRISLDTTIYSIKRATLGPNIERQAFSGQRTLPIFDIDSGLNFERTVHFDHHAYTQTLQPRLFYLFVPYKSQDQFPVFDTQLLPFSYDQLFSVNRLSGFDRLENANQVSLGIVSRLVNQDTGQQILRAAIGMAYYFVRAKVTIPELNHPKKLLLPYKGSVSPLVGELTWYPALHWSTTGSLAWDFPLHEINNAAFTLIYHNAGNRIFSIGYQYVRDIDGIPVTNFIKSKPTHLFSVGTAWPLTPRLSFLGYWYYNIGQSRPQTYYFGLQYSTCCWAIRAIAGREWTANNVNPITNKMTNQFRTVYYVQFMLKGLGGYGNSSAENLLRSTLPGYVDEFS